MATALEVITEAARTATTSAEEYRGLTAIEPFEVDVPASVRDELGQLMMMAQPHRMTYKLVEGGTAVDVESAVYVTGYDVTGRDHIRLTLMPTGRVTYLS